jgi:hypothetical protein
MIHDVDQLLEGLVRREALNGSGVEIAFDAPTKDWVARRNSPTVDLYLYDIREDLQRRQVNWHEVRNDDGIVSARRPPPRWFKLSYLVTAWTQRTEDEHRLLASLLIALLRHEQIEPGELTGPLAESKLPLHVYVGLPPSQDRSLADVWSALGGELKPSLDLTIVAPVVFGVSVPANPPVLAEPTLEVERPDGEGAEAAPHRGPRARVPARERVPFVEETVGATDRPGRRLRARGLPPR